MLTRQQMDRKLNLHFDFEARDDIEGVLATLARDVLPFFGNCRRSKRIDVAKEGRPNQRRLLSNRRRP